MVELQIELIVGVANVKLNELFEKELIEPTEFDQRAKEMSYPNVYQNKDVGGKTKISPQKVVVRDSKTGKVYGRRTVYQKDL